MDNKELSKAIRAALKAAGLPASAYSVRMQRGGLEYCADVTIKSAEVSMCKVNDILRRFRSVDRDERTGEICAGGNVYVFAQRDYKTPCTGSEYAEAVSKAIKELASRGDGAGVQIDGVPWVLFKENGYYLGHCAEMEKLDWSAARFRCNNWAGVADNICRVLKEYELDRAYLQSKGA